MDSNAGERRSSKANSEDLENVYRRLIDGIELVMLILHRHVQALPQKELRPSDSGLIMDQLGELVIRMYRIAQEMGLTDEVREGRPSDADRMQAAIGDLQVRCSAELLHYSPPLEPLRVAAMKLWYDILEGERESAVADVFRVMELLDVNPATLKARKVHKAKPLDRRQAGSAPVGRKRKVG